MSLSLGDLKIIHVEKGAGAPSERGQAEGSQDLRLALEGAFHLDSCQRWLWIVPPHAKLPKLPRAAKVFSGEEAYRFLLSLACGLESEVVGETDIFGQLKEMRRAGESADPAFAKELAPIFQGLFEDAKEIRNLYLQNLGGSSYGSLARMLLKESGAEERVGPLLLVGAGKIAASVAPYLCDFQGDFGGDPGPQRPLWILNRDSGRAETLRAQLAHQHPRAEIVVADPAKAWGEARDAVVCIPFDAEGDVARIAAWKGDCLLHLGGARRSAGPWLGLPGFQALDELFALRRRQGGVRSLQIPRARAACVERAKLRALGGSVTTAHGWEYLALFG